MKQANVFVTVNQCKDYFAINATANSGRPDNTECIMVHLNAPDKDEGIAAACMQLQTLLDKLEWVVTNMKISIEGELVTDLTDKSDI